MITMSNQIAKIKKDVVQRKNRSYAEVVEFLESCRPYEYSAHVLERMKALDKLFNNVSQKIDVILIGGTNGKSLTVNFAAKLLKEEGYKVGSAYSSHFLTFNERISLDSVQISNKSFTEVVDEVIDAAQNNAIAATAFEILTMSALLYFQAENVDVALLEVGMGGSFDATAVCTPKIAAITRVAHDNVDVLGDNLDTASFEMMGIARKGTWFISAEQSKLRLQKMKNWAELNGVKWVMPIRKLASLPYIYEQLYGRTASLGERIAQIYSEDIKGKFSPFLRGNLLPTQKGQRGRPTLEAKRQAQLNPVKTLKSFWLDHFDLIRGRFEILDKEKPSILLDNARNIDAFSNLFLGIRLLHYQRPIKGLALIIGFNDSVDMLQAVKLVRYLLKKVNGSLFLVPLVSNLKNQDLSSILAICKELNIKAKTCLTFAEAFATAKATVDERHGLVCITGSPSMVTNYWQFRDVKKL